MSLSEREKAIVDLERSWPFEQGCKESLIRDRLELSTTRYYELLTELLASPAAMAYDPLVIRRLRRVRDRRRRARYESAVEQRTSR